MAESTNDHPDGEFVDKEAALGGADAVEGTTYVVGKGTDPNALSPDDSRRHATPASGGWKMGRMLWWIVAVLVLICAVYVAGIVLS